MNIIFNYYIIEHNLEKMLSLFINISNIILKIKQFMTKKKRKEKKNHSCLFLFNLHCNRWIMTYIYINKITK